MSNDYAARKYAEDCNSNEYNEARGEFIDSLVEDDINETLVHKCPHVPFTWRDKEAWIEADIFIAANIDLSASGLEAQSEEFIKLRDWILANYRKELTAHYEAKSDSELRGD